MTSPTTDQGNEVVTIAKLAKTVRRLKVPGWFEYADSDVWRRAEIA